MKYLFLLLISVSCFAFEPKFHYKDCVKIVNGFYKDCKGTVESFEGVESYEVDVQCRGSDFFEHFIEADLEISKGCK